MLAKRAIGLFRLSEFTLRFPALIAGAVYLIALPRRPVWLLAAIAPVAAGVFSTAGGLSLALALCALAVRRPRAAPVLLGGAVASAPAVALPVGAYAVWTSVERVAIPALVTAFILLIVPLSHAEWAPAPSVGSREVEATRNTLLPWRGRAANIRMSPDLGPLVRFYKDRYRERLWSVSERFDATRPGVVVFNH